MGKRLWAGKPLQFVTSHSRQLSPGVFVLDGNAARTDAYRQSHRHTDGLVSDVAIFVLKRDVKLQLTN